MNLELIAVLISSFSLVAFSWLYLIGFRSYYDEATRQGLFEIRHRLWDLAHSGELDKESEAYQNVRALINGLLRFTHRLSLSHLFFMTAYFAIVKPPGRQAYGDELEAALKSLPEKQQDILRGAYTQAMTRVMLHVILCSWVLRPIMWIRPLFGRARKAKMRARSSMQGLTRRARLAEVATSEGLRYAPC